MTAEADDDPSEWGEDEILSRAIFELMSETGSISSFINVSYAGDCDCCAAMLIETDNEEARIRLSSGTKDNHRLSQLVERPVDLMAETRI